jgi:hypothetical protein
VVSATLTSLAHREFGPARVETVAAMSHSEALSRLTIGDYRRDYL